MKALTRFLIAYLVLLPCVAWAAPIDCDQSTLQTAITAASDSDTITCNAGSWTWTSTVTIANKQLILDGGGATITNNISSGTKSALTVTGQAKPLTIKNFIFDGTNDATNSNSSGLISISGTGTEIRVTNVTFQNLTNGRGLAVYGVYGVADNCTFTTKVGANDPQGVSVFGNADYGFELWDAAYTPGTANAFYIENSTFNWVHGSADSVLDMYRGARVVFRHNNVNGGSVGGHGLDSGGTASPHTWELYKNALDANGNANAMSFNLRGGTGVIWGNAIVAATGSYGAFTQFHNYRSCTNGGGHSYSAAWGICDGTDWKACSTHPPLAPGGWAAFYNCTEDSACSALSLGSCNHLYNENRTAVETTNTYYMDGAAADGYPCAQQIGYTTGMASAPVYLWNNNFKGDTAPTASVPADCAAEQSHIVANRDYFNNTAKVGYAAYDCPHPLTGLTGSCTSEAGTTGYNVATSWTVTPSTSTGCTVSPATAQTVTDGNTLAFTMTAAYGYSITATNCTLSGSTCTTAAVTGNLAVSCNPAKHMMEGIGTGSGSITGIGTGSGTITLGN